MNEDSALPTIRGGTTILVPALLCAGACVALMRMGFMALFFLVPLGFCSAAFGSVAAWCGFVIAALGNAVVSAGLSLREGAGFAGVAWDAAYFATLALGFTWIMAGNPPLRGQPLPRVRTLFRFVAASVAGALMFLGMAFALGREEGFVAMFRSQIEGIVSMYITSSGADAARQTFLERALTPDRIIEALSSVALRGGALASLAFMFFFNRQLSLVLARLLRRYGKSPAGDLVGFHAPRRAIWVLALCLLAVVASMVISFEAAEVFAWNVLTICVIMYLAQGGGIVLFTLARRPLPPFMRLVFGLLLVFLAFSPGLNMLALGALVLLGIAENWLPLRVIKQPAS